MHVAAVVAVGVLAARQHQPRICDLCRRVVIFEPISGEVDRLEVLLRRVRDHELAGLREVRHDLHTKQPRLVLDDRFDLNNRRVEHLPVAHNPHRAQLLSDQQVAGRRHGHGNREQQAVCVVLDDEVCRQRERLRAEAGE